MILIGLLSLFGTVWRLENLEVPFRELPRSFIAAILFSICLMSITLLINVACVSIQILKREKLSTFFDILFTNINRPRIKTSLIFILAIASVISGQILLQSDTSDNPLGILFVDTTEVFFIWTFVTTFISLIFLLTDKKILQRFKNTDVFSPFLLSVSLMTVLVLFNVSKFGFNKSARAGVEGDFRLTGFPILDYQALFTWIAVMGGFFLIKWLVNKWGNGKKLSAIIADLLIVLSLFTGSFIISNSVSVKPNAFIDEPRPPNFSISPNLDAEIYERTAQNLLAKGTFQTYIGEGDYLSIARRPLFTGYLAMLHWVGGLGYEDILPLLLLSFSIIPVLVYLFTKTIHNRISGILAAILIIIRHQNGLLLAGDVWGGNNLHMLMSDFPAMIIAVTFLTLVVLWIKNPQDQPILPMIIGGVLGLGMLIRQEIAFLLPIVSIVAIIKLKGRWKLLLKQLFLIGICSIVVITPWLSRNWVKTGKFYLDKPGNRVERIIQTISAFGDISSADDQVENPEEIGEAVQLGDPASEQVQPVNPAESESAQTIKSVIDHYGNAFQQLFLYLPSNPLMLNFDYMWKAVNGELKEYYNGVFYSPYKYSKSLPYWWFDQWDGKIDQKSWIYLTGIVGLISLGIYRVWKKERWIVFVPILSILGMISLYAINRQSGGRWLLTVDWLSAMFLSIGLVEISFGVLERWAGNNSIRDTLSGGVILEEDRVSSPRGTLLFLISLGIVLLGASPVIAEILLPNNYPESEMELKLSSLLDDENSVLNNDDQKLLHNFLDQGGEVIYGRALYPRYFSPDAKLMTTNQRLFPSSTTFTIAGEDLEFVVLSRLEPPTWFPQGTETLVIGCQKSSLPPAPGFPCLGCFEDEFEALVVFLYDSEQQLEDVLWHDGKNKVRCPMEND